MLQLLLVSIYFYDTGQINPMIHPLHYETPSHTLSFIHDATIHPDIDIPDMHHPDVFKEAK